MKLPSIPLAQTVIKLCELKGIKHIVLSPGSRNAPLVIGFTNQPFFKCYSIVDERSAAFFALGIAQQLNEPVAIICTSGSALLNYYPAVSEAFYSNIPLVVISADRPKFLIGIGDGQTIDQKNVFGNHSLFNANLKEDIKLENQSKEVEPKIIQSIENKFEKFLGIQRSIQDQNETMINKALNIAIHKMGPVHINAPFNDPLYETSASYSVIPKSTKPTNNLAKTDSDDLTDIIKDWNSSSKKMILVGVNKPKGIESQWLEKFANDESVIVFTETTSNLHHQNFFPSIDKIIAPLNDAQFKDLQPDILLTFGGLIVSKKIKVFLRKYQPNQHWHVGEKNANDTFFCLNKHLKGDVNSFFSQFTPMITNVKSTYGSHWNEVKNIRKIKHKEYLNQIEFSDLKVFDIVLKSIPDKALLQVGNSSAIRYLQLFDLNPTISVFCNRGTSGIDGCTSTAIGAATVSKEQTVFISGDLSFFYDSNALWNNYIPKNFRIILINNEGGGIFRILPGHKNTANFDTYFETKHHLTADHLCRMYNFEYVKAKDEVQLKEALAAFYSSSEQPKLMEIFTPRLENDQILLNYFNFIK